LSGAFSFPPPNIPSLSQYSRRRSGLPHRRRPLFMAGAAPAEVRDETTVVSPPPPRLRASGGPVAGAHRGGRRRGGREGRRHRSRGGRRPDQGRSAARGQGRAAVREQERAAAGPGEAGGRDQGRPAAETRGGRWRDQGRPVVGPGEANGGRTRGGRRRSDQESWVRFNLEERRRNKKEIKRNVKVHFANLVEICKAPPCHVSTDRGPLVSEIVLTQLNSKISAH
jgi:hypothetical protein